MFKLMIAFIAALFTVSLSACALSAPSNFTGTNLLARQESDLDVEPGPLPSSADLALVSFGETQGADILGSLTELLLQLAECENDVFYEGTPISSEISAPYTRLVTLRFAPGEVSIKKVTLIQYTIYKCKVYVTILP